MPQGPEGLTPSESQHNPIDRINAELTRLVKMKEELGEDEFLHQLQDLCESLPEHLRVLFDLVVGKSPQSALEEELRIRLEAGGVLNSETEAGRLVVMSPEYGFKDDIGNTSAGRNAILSGQNRNPFKADRFPDSNLEAGKSAGSRRVLSVYPTGLFLDRVSTRPYNLLASVISGVSVSEDLNLTLTPAIDENYHIIPPR